MKCDLAVIILNYNGALDTIECLESLFECKTEYTYGIFVLDNDSNQNDLTILKEFCERRHFNVECLNYFNCENNKKYNLILSDVNLGFARGNNVIVDKIKEKYRYFLLLNNDTVVEDTFLNEMIFFMDCHDEYKFSSCRINNYFERDKLWNCGGKLQPWGNRKYYTESYISNAEEIIPCTFITGCALMLKESLVKKYGVFTEDFFFGEEDFNFCWRMKKEQISGACLNKTLVYHKIHASINSQSKRIGGVAMHFANRVIDMKLFYPKPVWHIWKEAFILMLIVKCFFWKIGMQDRRMMINMIRKYMYKSKITRDDFLLFMNL